MSGDVFIQLDLMRNESIELLNEYISGGWIVERYIVCRCKSDKREIIPNHDIVVRLSNSRG